MERPEPVGSPVWTAGLIDSLAADVRGVLEQDGAEQWPVEVAVQLEKLSRNLANARNAMRRGEAPPSRAAPAPPQVALPGQDERTRRLEERRREIEKGRTALLTEEEAKTRERAAQAAAEAERTRSEGEEAKKKVLEQEAEIEHLKNQNSLLVQQCQCGAAAQVAADTSHRGAQKVKVLFHVESPRGSSGQAEATPQKEQKEMYRAAHTFNGTAAKHLSIKKGDILEIVAKPSGWWKARNEAAEEGLVPSNYLVAIDPKPEVEELPLVEAKEEEVRLRQDRVHGGKKDTQWKRTSMHIDQISNDVINQVKGWEESKVEFQTSMENVLASSKGQLERMCNDFMTRYKAAIDTVADVAGAAGDVEDPSKIRSFRSEFLRAVEVERKRLLSKAETLFVDEDIVSPVVLMITSMQRQVSGVDHSLVMAQAVIRGHLARKKWRPVLKQMKARSHIAREIHATEKQYLQSLHVLMNVFKARLDSEHAKQSLISSPSCSKADIATIFAHVDSIISVNSELLSRLDKRMADWTNNQLLGDIFEEITPYLKVYIQYVNNYDNVQGSNPPLSRLQSLCSGVLADKRNSGAGEEHEEACLCQLPREGKEEPGHQTNGHSVLPHHARPASSPLCSAPARPTQEDASLAQGLGFAEESTLCSLEGRRDNQRRQTRGREHAQGQVHQRTARPQV